MKKGKKAVSFVMVLVLLMGMVPAPAQATQTTVEDQSTVSYEGMNSLGNLISDAVSEAEQSQASGEENYTDGYGISDLSVEGSVATVTYDAMEEATLLVAVYTEDGLQLLNSGKTTISPEETVAEVTIEGTMPEYFTVTALLLDDYDFSPLCASYTTPMYTQQMQELLASTIYDYDEERVLNLDGDESTNFAVYTEDVVVIEPAEGVNIVTSIDDEAYTYTIENPDQQITSLTAGTIMAYAYEEGQLLLVKISDIQAQDSVAVIVGTEMEIEEVFDYLKIETAGDPENIQVDDSACDEGVTFEGVEMQTEPAVRATEGTKKLTAELKFSVDKEFMTEGDVQVGAQISGSLSVALDASFSYYISLSRQYVNAQTDLTLKANVEFSGVLKYTGIKLTEFTLPSPIAGVSFRCEPQFLVQFTATSALTAKYVTSSGFCYDSDTGWQSYNKKPSKTVESTLEGKVFIGVAFDSEICIISSCIASIGLTIQGGIQITGKMTGTDYEVVRENAAKVHTCDSCLSLRFDRVFQASVWIKMLRIFKTECKLAGSSSYLGDAYISYDEHHAGAGTGKCPHYQYRVTVKVQDKAGNVVPEQEVFLSTGESVGTTGDQGTCAVYLYAGEYTFQTTIGEELITNTRQVTNATRVVLTNNPELLAKLTAYLNKLIQSLDVKNESTYPAPAGTGTFSSGVTWKLYRSGKMVIEGEGAMNSYTKASSVPWYSLRDKITAVEIREGVTNVGAYAFSGCTNLDTVILADSVRDIGEGSFYSCAGLRQIRLPVDCVYTEDSFYNCSGVQKIQYGAGESGVMTDRQINRSYLYTYWYYSLERMSADSLQTVIFEEGVTNVGAYAFWKTTALTEVYLSETITSIGQYAFANSAVQVLELPETVDSIGQYAFSCSGLTQINLPEALQTIGAYAFEYCTGLTELVIPDQIGQSIGDGAFQGCSGLKKVTVPVDYAVAVNCCFADCSNVEQIHYTPGTTGIMTNRNTSGIRYSYYYYNTLEYLSRNSLKSISFDEGVTHIGNYAFYGSSALSYAELPSTLQSIGNYAFKNTGLAQVELPEGLQSIGEYTFSGSALTEIWFPESLQTIGAHAFEYNTGLTELVIPDHIGQNIGDGAFYYCTGLKKVTVPVDYVVAKDSCFGACDNVEQIHYTPGATGVMPDRNKNSTSYPYYCYSTLEGRSRVSLKEISFDEGITHIGAYAFYDSSALLYAELPSTLQSIGNYAFKNTGLAQIELLEGLQSIGEYAFSGSSLNEVSFTGDMPELASTSFENVTATVYYPQDNTTWTADKLTGYSGSLTWQSYAPAVTAELSEKAKTTRAIFSGQYEAEETEETLLQTAAFTGLVAGEPYVLLALVETDGEDLLSDNNLLAILQGNADENGTLTFEYVQRYYADVSYVFAAGASHQNLNDAQIELPPMTENGDVQTVEPVVTYQGQVLTEEVDYILVGQVDYTDSGAYTCYIRGVRAYTGLVECAYTVEQINVESWNLTLNDAIGVHFNVAVSDAVTDSAVVQITANGATESYQICETDKDDQTGTYGFSVELAAAQMTDPVTVCLRLDGEAVQTREYTVRQYADYILEETNGFDEQLKQLVTAMLHYGGAAQQYFAYNTEHLANEGIAAAAQTDMPETEMNGVWTGNWPDGWRFYGATLLFKSKTAVRFYFEADDITAYTFAVSGTQLQPTEADGMYYVEVSDIPPDQLDAALQLQVNETLCAVYTPVDYMIRMYAKSETMKPLMLAMYQYYLAAEAYTS